jgi:beta-fructofuranosidase
MSFSRRAFLQLSAALGAVPRLPDFFRAQKKPPSELCTKLASDELRPQYHLLPASNWMNDPNGPIYVRGRYHMFHQYNPKAAVWGNMNWAHATSSDMVYWHHEPIAMSPTAGGFDSEGVFSGSAVLDGGVPTVIYTGVMPPIKESEATLRDGVHTWREVQCLASSHDADLNVWQKLPEPVIAVPPPGIEVTGFRDPFMWREGDSWLLGLGSGIKNKGGMVLLYKSPDLRQWTYLHPLVEGAGNKKNSVNPVDTGDMWECPDFFPLEGKHVLLISTQGKVRWKVGTYKEQQFTPEKEGVVDWGAYYAAKTMPDADGNRILWGWIPETRPEAEHNAAGWAGVMALPRVLSLNSDGELQMEVLPALRKLRHAHTGLQRQAPPEDRKKMLDTLLIQDLAAEVSLEFRPKANEPFVVNLESEDGENFATLRFAEKQGARQLTVNELTAPLSGSGDAPVRLHLFLDGSVLEVFVNGTTTLTARIYHVPKWPLRLTMQGAAPVDALDVWQMRPISKDRLTGSLCS